MPRCGCANDQCSCTIVSGDNVTVEGTGSRTNPYVITAAATGGGGGGGGVARLPGEIIAYGGSSAPAGWLTCDGSAVSRTVYAGLFAILGVAYGAGDGSTTFNLPGLEGRFPLGLNGTYPRGSSGGAASITLTGAQLPSHSHSVDHDHASATTSTNGSHDHDAGHSAAVGTSGSAFREADASTVVDGALIRAAGDHSHALDVPPYSGTSGLTGTGAAVPALPPYVAVHYIVKT